MRPQILSKGWELVFKHFPQIMNTLQPLVNTPKQFRTWAYTYIHIYIMNINVFVATIGNIECVGGGGPPGGGAVKALL